MRKLNPRECNAAYHFHSYAEELFVIQQGSALLRTPQGIETVHSGDIIFLNQEKQVPTNYTITQMSLVYSLIYAPT